MISPRNSIPASPSLFAVASVGRMATRPISSVRHYRELDRIGFGAPKRAHNITRLLALMNLCGTSSRNTVYAPLQVSGQNGDHSGDKLSPFRNPLLGVYGGSSFLHFLGDGLGRVFSSPRLVPWRTGEPVPRPGFQGETLPYFLYVSLLFQYSQYL